MRTPSDAPDPFALGRKVETPKPVAAPTPVSPGIARNHDGKVCTTAPSPAPIWTAPAVPVVAPTPAPALPSAESVAAFRAEMLRNAGLTDEQIGSTEALEFLRNLPLYGGTSTSED